MLMRKRKMDAKHIPGLTYIPNYITPDQEVTLLQCIDKQPWTNTLKRRVQHYGYIYDYKARNITSKTKLGALPDWLRYHTVTLHSNGLFPKIPDQVIINEYQPGQGIASHIDCLPCFEETIASLSLCSTCIMEFTHNKTSQKISILLEPLSLLVIQKDARYIWKHGISSRKKESYNGTIFYRNRRVSLTFRKVILTA